MQIRYISLLFVCLIVICYVHANEPEQKFIDSKEIELIDSPATDQDHPRFQEKEKTKVKEGDPWWLKDVPWFLPPPPEWGPLPPTMYMSYWHKPYSPPLSTANYYPLYSKDSEFLPLAPSYPSNYPWTPGSFPGSSAPLTAVGPSIRVSPYLAYMKGGNGRTPLPSASPDFIEKSSHVHKNKHKKDTSHVGKKEKEEQHAHHQKKIQEKKKKNIINMSKKKPIVIHVKNKNMNMNMNKELVVMHVKNKNMNMK